jgi:pimeloyl-ACP methyl ester carboxylesterase
MTIRLAAVEYGAGPPVAILHGLFGSGRNWATIARGLAARHRVIALDLRNHGGSPWADTMDYREMAADALATLAGLGAPRAALIGHSMGGKAAMIAASADPAAVERLVVVDIAPVVYQPHHLGLVRAMRALDLTGVTRRAEADRRLAPAVPDPAERGFLLQNLVFEEAMPPRWRINLDAIERALPVLAGFLQPPSGVAYDGPALFVAGSGSDYVPPACEPEIRRLFPRARIVRIANAGHWVHSERPQAFLDSVAPFLSATD